MQAELERFYEALERTPRDWFLRNGAIGRLYDNPLPRWPTLDCAYLAVRRLDPDVCVSMELILPANDNDSGHDPEIRRRLLLACGFHV